MKKGVGNPGFLIKDCVLVLMAMGYKANTLQELRDILKVLPSDSLFYHFLPSIQISLTTRPFFNDFANWSYDQLHDQILAERLSLASLWRYKNLEDLRADLIYIIENRIDEHGKMREINKFTEPFHFMKCKLIVFDTLYKLDQPKDLLQIFPLMPLGSIFFHFIYNNEHTNAGHDFKNWLCSYGNEYRNLLDNLGKIDPSYMTIKDVQNKIASVVSEYFLDANRYQNE